MKKIITILLYLFLSIIAKVNAQAIINLVMVGKDGITEDVKQAISYIIIKLNADNSFEKLEYNMRAPLVRSMTYKDTALEVLDGPYYQYDEGNLNFSGKYKNNRKEGSWYYYNDTGKIVLEQVYVDNRLIRTIEPDTVKKDKQYEESLEAELKDGRSREASFTGGQTAYRTFLFKNINPDVGVNSVKGGTVRVGFVIDIDGKITDIHIRKSVEFLLDEEALRVIRRMPPWLPAWKNRQQVKAFRIQPITFIVEGN